MKTNINHIYAIRSWNFINPEERAIPLPGGMKIPVSAVKRLQAFPMMKKGSKPAMKDGREIPMS